MERFGCFGGNITVVSGSNVGREAILAKIVIDATGDADVAHRAGSPSQMSPREDLMAASVMFHLAGVDKRAFVEGVNSDPQTYADWGGGGEWNRVLDALNITDIQSAVGAQGARVH